MPKFHLVVDSCCNLPPAFFEANPWIKIIGMPVEISGKEFIDGPDSPISHEVFYQRLNEGELASTSQIPPQRYLAFFQELKDKPIYYIGLSSGMSSTIESAHLAANQLEDQEIHIIDPLNGSVALGSMIYDLVEKIKEDENIDIRKHMEYLIPRVCIRYCVSDMNYLKRSGRLPAHVAALANVLNMRPVLSVDEAGHLSAIKKVRGKKKAMEMLIESVGEFANEETKRVHICHGAAEADGLFIKEEIEKRYQMPTLFSEEGPTIGAHTGPGVLVVAFIGKHR